MDTSSDIFQSRLYNINRILLSLLGQWPFQKVRNRRAILATILFIGITQALTQVLAIITLRNDFDAVIECVAPLMIIFLCIVKLSNLISNMNKFKMLYIHMQRDWQSWVIKSELKILHKFAEKGRAITIGYTGGFSLFGGTFPLLAIIPKIIGANVTSSYTTRPVGLPYHVEYYLDLNKYFYPVLIHNYVATAIRITTIIASDTCLIILVLHCCALFSVVRYRLEHIQNSIEQDKNLSLLEKDDRIYKNFVYCIKKHNEAMRFVSSLEAAFTKALFLEVGLMIIMMTSSALQATNHNLTIPLAIRHGAYILTQLLHIYLVSWLGQQVIDHSDRVYTSIYKGEWYESSSKSIKLLNMIMLRSNTPCTITLGKIIILSLPTFSAVIRVSASYFTVMQSVK